jgi:hypothetical protein
MVSVPRLRPGFASFLDFILFFMAALNAAFSKNRAKRAFFLNFFVHHTAVQRRAVFFPKACATRFVRRTNMCSLPAARESHQE